MGLLQGLSTPTVTIEAPTDSIGGGGKYNRWPTAIYGTRVVMAYTTKSSGGATGLALTIENTDGAELNQTIWFTKKTGEVYYEKDGKNHYLPGFALLNELCQLTCGKDLLAMDEEDRVVNVYSYDKKADVPTNVSVLIELLNKEIFTAVFDQIEDKGTKQSDGSYLNQGETRETNEISKFFGAHDKLSAIERANGATTPGLYDEWDSLYTGEQRDRSSGVGKVAGNAPAANAPVAQAAAQPAAVPTSSIFAK